MMHKISTGLLIMILATPLLAEQKSGKALHDQYCQKCHDDSVYTRPDRFIKDRAALHKQVSRCGLNTGAQWFDEDVEAVVQYLDQTYYGFQ